MKLWLGVLLLLLAAPPAHANNPTATATQLAQALQGDAGVIANCPTLVGVTIGDTADKATWSATYATTPSGACNTATAAVITAFAAPPVVPGTMALTSTGTAALDATYATDPATLNSMNNISVYLKINGTFPVSGTTVEWPDVNNTAHTFTITAWQNFAKAVGDFVYQESQGVTVSQPVNIP